jgi:hypothetical protein
MQLRGEQPGKDEQTAGHFKTKGYGKCPAGKGPVLLAYMLTVERQIKEVIDDIDCRSRRRKCEKSNDRIAQYGPVHDLVIEYGRNENQRVLHPLMRAQHPEEGFPVRLWRLEQLGRIGPLPFCRRTIRRNNDGLARRIEHGNIRLAISCIGKFGVAKGLEQKFGLARRSQIALFIGCVDRIEKTQMRSDTFGKSAGSSRCEHQSAPFSMLFAQVSNEITTIWKYSRIDCNPK